MKFIKKFPEFSEGESEIRNGGRLGCEDSKKIKWVLESEEREEFQVRMI